MSKDYSEVPAKVTVASSEEVAYYKALENAEIGLTVKVGE